ncbi:calcium/sodium antiporter [bacterium]|nr:calcium/sodium antiporter [candidate division CSSED10-310 bacterium]
MIWAVAALITGLIVLVWSADRFVDGSAAAARHLGAPPLLIGMVIVGFGTSAPEMLVSAISALQGNPGIALGNAYGSNITNIALILGLVAVIKPIAIQSGVLRREMPILIAVTVFAVAQLLDYNLTRWDALILLAAFGILMTWTVMQSKRSSPDAFGTEIAADTQPGMPYRKALLWIAIGLGLLLAASRILVWGAVIIARELGVSDLIIGLTIVAIGTSLPELASSIAAARKNEHDIALGNILGSNLFNTLAVVGIAGIIRPMPVDPAVITRDAPAMTILTVSLFLFAYGFTAPGRINRYEGATLLASYVAYISWLVITA